jgi:hypothetical protein
MPKVFSIYQDGAKGLRSDDLKTPVGHHNSRERLELLSLTKAKITQPSGQEATYNVHLLFLTIALFGPGAG